VKKRVRRLRTGAEKPEALIREVKKIISLNFESPPVPQEKFRLEYLETTFLGIYERSPANFGSSLGVAGGGTKTLFAH
jgi:hypothetical protein